MSVINRATERKDIPTERKDITIEQRKHITTERNDITTERKDIATERKDITTERKDISTERKDITTERKDITTERKDITTERKHITTERKDITTERKDITTERKNISTVHKIQDYIIKKLNTTEVNESRLISELLNLLKKYDRDITEFRTNIENIKQHTTDLQTFISMRVEKMSQPNTTPQSVTNSANCKDYELWYKANRHARSNKSRIQEKLKLKKKPCKCSLHKEER
ncbi:unnamed protein product [Mytilus edulis]|uniref:Uncharacterized protein n=1 Tax=Mytilus edulis TaxID=6550 RepID=A0A8S3TQ81_MYTED|nr:unnamed protein product [Mytilus edulis]